MNQTTDTTTCSYCGGVIKSAAKICKHCTRPVGASLVMPSAPPPAWAATGPSPVLVELRSFVLQRGILRREQADPILQANPGVDTDGALGHLTEAGCITPVQAESIHNAFWQHQCQGAQAVLNAALQRGLLMPAHVEAAMSQFEAVALQHSVGEFLVGQQLLTAAQISDLVVPPAAARSRGAVILEQWNRFSRTGKGVAVAGLVTLVAVGWFALHTGPALEPACFLNGRGEGRCVFTNATSSSASGCGHVEAWCEFRSGPGVHHQSETFCSGDVAARSTKNVEFSIPSFDRDSSRFNDWRSNCTHAFFPEHR